MHLYISVAYKDICIYTYLGVHQQYDPMVFPHGLSISTSNVGVMNKVMSFIGWRSSEKSDVLKVPTNYDMRHQCLMIYLEGFQHILKSQFNQSLSVDQFVECVCQIFTAFCINKVTNRNSTNERDKLHNTPERKYQPKKVLFIKICIYVYIIHIIICRLNLYCTTLNC